MMRSNLDLRLMTRVARLYHEDGLTQTEVAHRLGITQVTVSRLLKKAEELGIVRTTVVPPPGAVADLERSLEATFGLRQVIIGDAARDAEAAVLNAIGSAAAHFLESTLRGREVIGISSGSASLLAMVEHMHPRKNAEIVWWCNSWAGWATPRPSGTPTAWPCGWPVYSKFQKG